MDVTIIAAMIGAVGSIIATVLGALIAQRSASRSQPPTAPPQSQRTQDPTVPDPVPAAQPRVGIVPLFLIALGSFLAFTGFALVGYVVLSFIVAIFTAIQSNAPSPPDLSTIPFVPFLPVGFGLMFGGIVIIWLGILSAGISLARSRRTHHHS